MQAPAREALELIGPSRKPSPNAPAPHRTPVPAPAAPQAPAARHPHNAAPHPHPEPHQPAPRTAVPPAPQGLPNNTNVCALGRKYGGWKADSPEAVICKGTYGN